MDMTERELEEMSKRVLGKPLELRDSFACIGFLLRKIEEQDYTLNEFRKLIGAYLDALTEHQYQVAALRNAQEKHEESQKKSDSTREKLIDAMYQELRRQGQR
jgi:hypothetical protein